MWTKIKDFFDIKPQCHYDHQVRLAIFEYLNRQRKIDKMVWTLKGKEMTKEQIETYLSKCNDYELTVMLDRFMYKKLAPKD